MRKTLILITLLILSIAVISQNKFLRIERIVDYNKSEVYYHYVYLNFKYDTQYLEINIRNVRAVNGLALVKAYDTQLEKYWFHYILHFRILEPRRRNRGYTKFIITKFKLIMPTDRG